jgi:hypothetical protein
LRFEFLSEPELEFGSEGRHIDIRFGLMDYGPADVGAPRVTCSPLLVQLFPDSCSSGGGKRSDAALVLVGPRSGGAALQ